MSNQDTYKRGASNLPNGWAKLRLDEVATLTRGPFGSSLKKEMFVPRGYKVYEQQHAIRADFSLGDYYIDEEAYISLNRFSIQPGDIIMSCSGTAGKFAIVPIDAEPGVINQALLKISVKPLIDLKYFFFFVHSSTFQSSLFQDFSGGAIKNIAGMPTIRKLPVFTPPLPEQRKIAAILSTWDQAIELVGKQIAAKQRLKKALMQRLLTGKVRFPGYKKEWKEVKLGAIGKFSKGAGITKADLVETGIPCIRYGEIYTTHDFAIKKFTSFIGPETANASVQIQTGDILFAGSGETPEDIGKCVAFLGGEKAYAGGDVIIFRSPKSNPRFMGYLLNHHTVNRQKYSLAQGHSVVHIYPSLLKAIVIPFPSFEEQETIANLLDLADREINCLLQKREGLQQQKRGLMQKLLTGEVRVRV